MNTNNSMMRKVIEMLLQIGLIKFKRFSNCWGLVDVEITSGLFMETEKGFFIEIYEDDWSSDPTRAVVTELVELISNGEINFSVPLCKEIQNLLTQLRST